MNRKSASPRGKDLFPLRQGSYLQTIMAFSSFGNPSMASSLGAQGGAGAAGTTQNGPDLEDIQTEVCMLRVVRTFE